MTRADGAQAVGSDRDVVLRVLGPVRVRTSQAWQVPVTAQLRLVVGIMAVRAGQMVAVDELIDALWDSAPPRSARGSLQSQMTRIRHLLEPLPDTALTRCGDGYRIELDADDRESALLRLADTYRSAGNQEHARTAWRQARVILDELHDLSAGRSGG